jgi:hypothetical protein
MKMIFIQIISYLLLFNILYSIPSDYFIANKFNLENSDIDNIYKQNTKKIVAMGMSAVFPGSGHFYLGHNKVGAAYMGIELAGWMLRDDYKKKINRSSEIYKEYAQEHWSLAKWIKDYFNPTADSIEFNCVDGSNACVVFRDLNSEEVYQSFIVDGHFSSPWDQSHKIDFFYSPSGRIVSTNSDDFKTIYEEICNITEENQNFICLNIDGTEASLEDIEQIVDNGDLVYDHHLYEGVSKYNMYFAGWTDSYKGNMQKVGSGYNVVYSPLKEEYENNLRANHKKNNERANNVLSAILINHAVSVLDIIFRNKNIAVSSENQLNQYGEYRISKIKFSIGLN